MDRRNFLKITSTALASSIFPLKQVFADASRPTVWELHGAPEETIKTLFSALGGMNGFAPNGLARATVLIKPNICLPNPAESGTVTSPEVVDALCSRLAAEGVKRIIVADHTLRRTKDFKNIALQGVAEKYREVKLVLANEQRFYQPVHVGGKVLESTEILKSLRKVNIVINVAAAKHHTATGVSLATKNLMGLIWDRAAFHTQLDLHQAIADLALAVRPTLNIIDASRVLLEGGPTGPGPVINEARLFAGLDMLALDSVVVSRYNFGGKHRAAGEIDHLQSAYRNGIGEIRTDKIDTVFL